MARRQLAINEDFIRSFLTDHEEMFRSVLDDILTCGVMKGGEPELIVLQIAEFITGKLYVNADCPLQEKLVKATIGRLG